MKSHLLRPAIDLVLVGMTAFFFFGCLATGYRGPRTLGPGQFSVGAGYTHATLNDVDDADAARLLHVDGRVGLGGGADLGLAHTSDLTEDSDGAFSTFWGDARFQLSNRENRVGVPIFTLGIAKGFLYKEDLDIHVTSLPLQLGVPVHERVTPWLLYRPDFLSDDFFPDGDSFENPRHTIMIGSEFALAGSESSVVPRLGIGVGWVSSLTGFDEGDEESLTMFQVGITIETPRRR